MRSIINRRMKFPKHYKSQDGKYNTPAAAANTPMKKQPKISEPVLCTGKPFTPCKTRSEAIKIAKSLVACLNKQIGGDWKEKAEVMGGRWHYSAIFNGIEVKPASTPGRFTASVRRPELKNCLSLPENKAYETPQEAVYVCMSHIKDITNLALVFYDDFHHAVTLKPLPKLKNV